MVVGLSVAASAQKGDNQNRPPKPPPPVVNPAPKPPKDSDKPKKPTSAMLIIKARTDEETV